MLHNGKSKINKKDLVNFILNAKYLTQQEIYSIWNLPRVLHLRPVVTVNVKIINTFVYQKNI